MRTFGREVWKPVVLLAVAAALALPPALAAENRIGGHFGFVVPLVTWVDGESTTVSDDFKIGFPVGITVKRQGRMAFDLELVPVVQDHPLGVDLTVHPGLIWNLGPAAAGVRVAFDVNQASWGFTPLLAKGFKLANGQDTLFAEVDLPIRFQENRRGDNQTAVTVAAHFGWAF
jgi:hypothetical protein